MSPLSVALLVAAIVLAVGAVQATVWTVVLRSRKREFDRVTAELVGRIAAAGERAVRGPMRVQYSGATGGPYGRTRGTAVAATTELHLYLQTFRGPPLIFPGSDDVRGVSARRSFKSSVAAGWTHVVLELAGGDEIGFAVRTDAQAWVADISTGIVR